MNIKKKIKIVRNAQGFRVRVCCGSCKHKEIVNDGTRTCLRTRLGVEQFGACRRWEMSDGLMGVGREQGKVKSLPYLTFVFQTRMQEQEAIGQGLLKSSQVASTEELRTLFEEQFQINLFVLN